MVKFVLLFPKKKGISREEFTHQWQDECIPQVRELPNLRRLVINEVIEQPGAKEARYDGIAEWYFDDAAAGKAALESPQAQAVLKHMPTFVDMDNFVLTVTNEKPIIEGAKHAKATA